MHELSLMPALFGVQLAPEFVFFNKVAWWAQLSKFFTALFALLVLPEGC